MSFGNNIEVKEDENYAVVSVNPDIFSLEVIYSAAYTYLDKAYFILAGDPAEEVKVKLRPKQEDTELEKLALKLQNELINYSVYVVQAARNQDVRNAIISRALATNRVSLSDLKEGSDTVSKGSEQASQGEDTDIDSLIGPSEDADYIEDPEGIAEPWSPDKAEGLEAPDIKEDDEGD